MVVVMIMCFFLGFAAENTGTQMLQEAASRMSDKVVGWFKGSAKQQKKVKAKARRGRQRDRDRPSASPRSPPSALTESC